MAKRIHFEDGIFYVEVLLRSARDALALELDPDLFLGKAADDTFFVDRTLDRLLTELLDNERLIERDDRLANLREAEGRFLALLDGWAEGRGSLAAAAAPYAERFEALRGRSAARIAEIDSSGPSGAEADDPSLVSSSELNELLKGME